MGLFEGKSPNERNKIIAAIVLGVLATASLIYTFGPSLIGSGKPVRSSTSDETPTPTSSPLTNETQEIRRLPEQNEIDSQYSSLPVNYLGSGAFSVPVTGRNIFAFWEPGDPTPIPIPSPSEPTPIPTPTPVDYQIFLSFVTPQSVYAGSNGFKIEVNGDKFAPESRILFNGVPLATSFVSEQRLTGNIPSNLISGPFEGNVMVDTPGTPNFSRRIAFIVQAPPKPEFEYIGMIARQHYNNDTAYFQEKGARRGDPFSARLNDVVKGRFRVVSISEKEVEFQDTKLGFKHKLALLRPKPGTSTGTSGRSGYDVDRPSRRGRNRTRNPVGIPGNIRRVNPRRSTTNRRNPTRRNTNTNQKRDDNR